MDKVAERHRTRLTETTRSSDIIGVVDLGGTKMMAGIVDRNGCVLNRKIVPTPKSGPDDVIAGVTDLLAEVMKAANVVPSDLVGIGASLPGLVDRKAGVLDFWPVRGWRDIEVAGPIAERFGCRVGILNDVDGCALAEGRFGVAAGVADFMWVTVSTGVGGAVVLNGELHRGARGLAGEIGHIPVGNDSLQCSCGRYGCLEATASGPSLAKRARSLGLPVTEGADVGRLASENNPTARFLMDQASEAIGHAIAVCVNLLDIELIVLGGGVSQSLNLDLAERVAHADLIAAEARNLRIARTGLGAEAALIGSAVLVLQMECDDETRCR
jgi:glucokinase